MNIKTRLLHFAALALGALTIVATLLQKLPKYAAVAGSGLLLIANVEKMWPGLVDAIKKIFPASATPAGLIGVLVARALTVFAIFAMLATSGCATLSSAKTCEPKPADVLQVVPQLTKDNYESLLEDYAERLSVCVVNNIVSTFISEHQPSTKIQAALTASATGGTGADDAVAVAHGRSWLVKHGG